MVSYRQVTVDDIPAVANLLPNCEVFRFGENEAVSGWLAGTERGAVGVAFADRERGNLLAVVVDRDFCGQGIGRELLRQAEAWLFSHGWNALHFEWPPVFSEQSLTFFEHLGWQGNTGGEGSHLSKKNPGRSFSLEEHMVGDPETGLSRLVRLQRGPTNQSHHLCLFLDGEHYWRDMDAVPLLNDQFKANTLPPLTIAMVGHVSGADRHEDYTCNDQYAKFIAEVVIPWLEKEVPSVKQGEYTICGLSLSGLMATYLTLQYPGQFRRCVSQSGSHWWRHDWCADMVKGLGPIDARFWMSVGNEETDTNVSHPPTGLRQDISQIEGVEKVAGILKEMGGAVKYSPYHGGHSLRCWRDELVEALLWVLAED